MSRIGVTLITAQVCGKMLWSARRRKISFLARPMIHNGPVDSFKIYVRSIQERRTLYYSISKVPSFFALPRYLKGELKAHYLLFKVYNYIYIHMRTTSQSRAYTFIS